MANGERETKRLTTRKSFAKAARVKNAPLSPKQQHAPLDASRLGSYLGTARPPLRTTTRVCGAVKLATREPAQACRACEGSIAASWPRQRSTPLGVWVFGVRDFGETVMGVRMRAPH